MRGLIIGVLVSVCFPGWALARQIPQSDQSPGQNQAPPRSDEEKSRARRGEAGESSSRDTRIDISPPKEDAKDHPNRGTGVSDADEGPSGDVQELRPFNPYRAAKDNEVGDYYFKRKNYKAALARYQDALIYKENDAVANFRMAQCYEKLDQPGEAVTHYQEYLRILPQGPLSKDARKALAKLGSGEKQTSEKTPPK